MAMVPTVLPPLESLLGGENEDLKPCCVPGCRRLYGLGEDKETGLCPRCLEVALRMDASFIEMMDEAS